MLHLEKIRLNKKSSSAIRNFRTFEIVKTIYDDDIGSSVTVSAFDFHSDARILLTKGKYSDVVCFRSVEEAKQFVKIRSPYRGISFREVTKHG